MSEPAVPVIPELPHEWKLDDLALLPDDGHRYEIVDGGLHVSPPPSLGHQVFASHLGYLLHDAGSPEFVTVQGVGIDFGRSMFIPDISVLPADVARADVPLVKPSDVLLAVEVVSPSSVTMDRVLKRTRYAEAGIPSYWLVESREGVSIAVHELDGGRYRETAVVRAGERLEVDRPFRITLAPSMLTEPRQ